MSAWKDIVNQKEHMLTAIEYVGKNENGKSLWRCQCDCGNETMVTTEKFGRTKSCGCLRHQTSSRFKDLKNQRFGRWLVLDKAPNKISKDGHPQTMWKCLCDCGTIRNVNASNLLVGASVSCGCKFDIPSKQNLIGNRFDELVVIEQLDEKQPITYKTKWLCKCDCGGKIIRRGTALLRNGSHNCGKCNQIRGYRLERGYRYIYKPDYPGNKEGWIQEHKYVYETKTGKSIPRGYKLHHIDMDKQDNRIENLWLCTNKEHADAHNSINSLIKKLMERGIVGFSDGEYYRKK